MVLYSAIVLYGAIAMVRLLVPWSPVSQMPGNGVSSPVTDVDEDDYDFGS